MGDQEDTMNFSQDKWRKEGTGRHDGKEDRMEKNQL